MTNELGYNTAVNKSMLPPRGRCYDIQHNDTQHNDTQHNDIQHNDIEHYDTQHYDNQHNNKLNTTLSIMAECCYCKCHK